MQRRTHKQAHRQTDGEAGTQTTRQTDGQKERHIDRQTDRHTHTQRQTDRQCILIYRQRPHTHTQSEGKKQTDTETELLTFHGLIVPLFVVVIDDHGAKVGLDIGQGLVRNEGSMLLTNVIKLFTAVSCNFS
jgi:hypothetical protein